MVLVLVVALSVLAVGSIATASTRTHGGNINVSQKPDIAMVGFGNGQSVNLGSAVLAVNVDNLKPEIARSYINMQLSKLRPVIVVGNPKRVLHELLNSTNVAAVPVAMIINGKEVPVKKVVVGYIPRRINNKIGGRILCQEYNGVKSVMSMYQKINTIENRE